LQEPGLAELAKDLAATEAGKIDNVMLPVENAERTEAAMVMSTEAPKEVLQENNKVAALEKQIKSMQDKIRLIEKNQRQTLKLSWKRARKRGGPNTLRFRSQVWNFTT